MTVAMSPTLSPPLAALVSPQHNSPMSTASRSPKGSPTITTATATSPTAAQRNRPVASTTNGSDTAVPNNPNALPMNHPDNSPTCSNCSTQTTPLWRRSENGDVLCNACSLYQKMKGCPRPVSLKTDVIKHRNRSKGAKKEKPIVKAPTPSTASQSEESESGSKPTIITSRRTPSTSRTREEGGKKSVPGGSSATLDGLLQEHFDEISGRMAVKRRKRESPDRLSHASFAPLNMDILSSGSGLQAALHHAAAHAGFSRRTSEASTSRSSSVDGHTRSRGSSLPRLRALDTRSPSQPPFPPHMRPPGYGHASSMHPFFVSPSQHQQQHQQQPRDSSETWTHRGGAWAQETPGSTLTLPSIRNMSFGPSSRERGDNASTPEDDSRGRQRERFTLQPMQGFSGSAASHMLSGYGRFQNGVRAHSHSQSPSSVTTVGPSSPYLPMSMHLSGSGTDHHFPQSDSRRPPSAVSDDSSSGSGPVSSVRHGMQSPALSPMPERRFDPRARLSDSRRQSGEGTVSRNTHSPPGRATPDHTGANPNDAAEVNKLRMRVAELELINSLLVSRVNELEGSKRPSPNDDSSKMDEE